MRRTNCVALVLFTVHTRFAHDRTAVDIRGISDRRNRHTAGQCKRYTHGSTKCCSVNLLGAAPTLVPTRADGTPTLTRAERSAPALPTSSDGTPTLARAERAPTATSEAVAEVRMVRVRQGKRDPVRGVDKVVEFGMVRIVDAEDRGVITKPLQDSLLSCLNVTSCLGTSLSESIASLRYGTNHEVFMNWKHKLFSTTV